MMKTMYALALASLLAAPAAVLADEHVLPGNQGCTVQHPDGEGGTFEIKAKNPGQLFRQGREAHNPKEAADGAGFESVGALIEAVCRSTPD
jgi:hypothetical protein